MACEGGGWRGGRRGGGGCTELTTSPPLPPRQTDVRAAAALCREAGVPLVVDEAHGSHLAFMDGASGWARPAAREGAAGEAVAGTRGDAASTAAGEAVAGSRGDAASTAVVANGADTGAGAVDSGHGGGALDAGADLVIQSTHKTLTSLTQVGRCRTPISTHPSSPATNRP